MSLYYNVKDLVKIYPNIINDNDCNNIIKMIEKSSWEEHAYYDYQENKHVNHDREFSVSWDHFEGKDKLYDLVWNTIHNYIFDHLKEYNQWFSNWNGFSTIRFNKYTKETFMKIHCDHIQSLFDGERKGVPFLTVLGSLNNDYEGGDLLMWEDEKIDLPAGSIMIFPSNFMYPHSVSPITKGTRYSFVSWVW